MKKSIYFATFLFLMFPLFSKAQTRTGPGFYFEETMFPVYVNRNDTQSLSGSGDPGVATESGLGYDLRSTLGYVFDKAWLLGVTYNLYHLQTKRSYVSGGSSGLDETTDRNEWGPTIGWVPGNWRLLFTLFTFGKKKVQTINDDNTGITGDNTFTNTGLTGYQLMAGYTFQVTSSFGMGPTLVYRNVSYSKQAKTNALNSVESYEETSLTSAAVEGTLSAMFSLVFQF